MPFDSNNEIYVDNAATTSMSKDVFLERKNNAVFIDREDYLLMNLLTAI